MRIEADYYLCAGDLVSWQRGLDKMGEIHDSRAPAVFICFLATTNPSATSPNSANATAS